MNPEFFIARRLIKRNTGNFSDPIIRIAIIAVALGLIVMILAIAIIIGFKHEISSKVIGFGGHIQVSNFDNNYSYEVIPIEQDPALLRQLKDIPGVKHVQSFGNKPGIIKTENDIQGVVLKGIGRDFDWDFFKEKMINGSILQLSDTAISNDILISKKLASLLKLETGNDVRMYFIIDDLIRARRFTIKGIYETGLEDFDKMFVLCDIGQIQKLNSWESNQVAGFEILVNDLKNLDQVANEVYTFIPYDTNARTIKEIYPQIFDWLKLQDMNVIIILTLMILVAIITMISALLILILERTNTIGLLKALGCKTWNIRKIFLIIASNIALKGIFWGNLIGLSLVFVQKYSGIIKLSQESYYVSVVPIQINFFHLLVLNLATLLITIMALVIPSVIISAISPVKAIRYE
ncbi:MAG: ABC transporter permease [Bacteroidales bacterium]|nr:ABC transporter permease [Bacteroidales bacterium]